MNNILFFDTETTGNEEKDRLCQIAYKTADKTFCSLYKPRVPISIESMAVHHITSKMVEDKPFFSESKEYLRIKELFEAPDTVPVAHNAKFDLAMLAKEDIKLKRFICTLRVARYLDEDGMIPNYRLQFLRYYLGIDIKAVAHDALGDVLVLEALFTRLLGKIMDKEGCTKHEAIAKMEEISSRPSIFKTMIFGKYKGEKMEDIVVRDRDYLKWLLSEKMKTQADDDEDWIHTLKHFLGML